MKKPPTKNTQWDDVLEIVNFVKDNMMTRSEGATKDEMANMATKDDIANMATKNDIANMATKNDIANMATKDDVANMATKDDIAELRERIVSLEKGQEKILDILEPLSRAHDKDSVTLMDHGKRITRIEKNLVIT